jgi:type VI secretion system secreted protein Hcp
MKTPLFKVTLLAILFSLAMPSFSAADMFIKIEGIEGESADGRPQEHIDILGWRWGMSATGKFHAGGGGPGKVDVQDLNFIKSVDKSTPLLMNYCATGKPIPTATLEMRRAGEAEPYLVIEMKNILVSSASSGSSGGEGPLTENITLNFESYKVVYEKQKKDGSTDHIEHGWNIMQNKKA